MCMLLYTYAGSIGSLSIMLEPISFHIVLAQPEASICKAKSAHIQK